MKPTEIDVLLLTKIDAVQDSLKTLAERTAALETAVTARLNDLKEFKISVVAHEAALNRAYGVLWIFGLLIGSGLLAEVLHLLPLVKAR